MRLFKEKHIRESVAITISLIFNAYVTSVLPLVIALFISHKEITNYLVIAALIILAPFAQFLIFYTLKLVSDFDISDREQRPFFMVFSSLIYLFVYLWAYSTNIELVIKVSLALVITTVFFTLISTFWKISGHMTYLLFTIVSINYIFNSNALLLLFIFVPIVAWARIELKHHTPMQTILGTLTAAFISFSIYALI